MTNPTPMPSLLANRYRVLKVLGDGGFGTTYLAEDSQMPSLRKCVVKQLKPVEDNPQIYELVKERFQREAAILEMLGDGFDQIPHLYAYFSEGEQFFLVEEWVEGLTLTQKVQQSGVFPEATVRTILNQTLQILSYIHAKRMVHRDIKPDNIILRQVDQIPVLIDFGAVKETMSTVVNSQGDSARSIVVGTPGFMPSEQMAGRPLFSSDLYSLGLTAIYLLTGRIPQDLETDPGTGTLLWKHLAPQVTPGFANLLDRSIQMNPRDRFQTAQQMKQGLQSFEAETIVPNQAVAPTEITPPSYPGTTTPQYPPANQSPPSPPVAMPPPQVSPNYSPELSASTPAASGQPTVQIPGVANGPASTPAASQSSSSGDWKKAGLIGGLIGLSILGGAMVLREPISDLIGNRGNDAEEVEPSPSPTPSVNPTPPASSPPVASPTPEPPATTPAPDPPAEENWETDAQIIGAAGQKNIRSGPGTNFPVAHIAYPGDRVQVLAEEFDGGGFLWYMIYFPKSGAEGWIAGQLLKVDGEPAYIPPAKPPAEEPEPPESAFGPNATIVGSPGSKNIRSGPGTEFDTLHIAYPGDRIEILESDIDTGGFQWFLVYFPKSGAQGWIAGQLVQIDASP